jgi:hypothetical protein
MTAVESLTSSLFALIDVRSPETVTVEPPGMIGLNNAGSLAH